MARIRGLTVGEVDLLRSLFGGSLDYRAIRVHHGRYLPLQPPDVAMAPNGAAFFPNGHFSSDFAAEKLERQAWFVHEMAHVWQHQNRVTQDLRLLGLCAAIAGLYGRPGPVTGAPGRYLYDYGHCHRRRRPLDLGDFGFEPQAMIIEDYFRATNGSDFASRALFEDERRGLLRYFLKDPASLRRRRSWRIVRRA